MVASTGFVRGRESASDRIPLETEMFIYERLAYAPAFGESWPGFRRRVLSLLGHPMHEA